jgi:hypothetical protein
MFTRKTISVAGYALFFFLILCDIVVEKFPAFGIVGTIGWCISFALIVFYLLWNIYDYFILRHRFPVLTVVLLLIWTSLLLIHSFNHKNLSGEVTQEISCMLQHFSDSTDWGFAKSCFLGYPTKQFIIPSLPSLILGRTVFALQFGGAIYVLTGLFLFSFGILQYFQNKKHADIFASLFLACLFHVYYINFQFFYYEQSAYPVGFVMMLCGLFLFFLKDRKKFPLFLFGYVLLYLIFSYTSSLAVFFLACVVGLYTIVRSEIPTAKKLLLLVILTSLFVSYHVSLNTRTDIKLVKTSQRNEVLLKQDIQDAFEHLVWQNKGNPFVSPLLSGLLLFAVVCMLFDIRRWQFSIIVGWTLLVILFAVISQGYAYAGIDYRLHRAIVVFPVIYVAFLLWLKPYMHKSYERILIYFIIFLTITGLFFNFRIVKKKQLDTQSSYQFVFLKHLETVVPNMYDIQNITFIKNSDLFAFSSFDNYSVYFYPKLKSKTYEIECPRWNKMSKGIFVIDPQSKCLTDVAKDGWPNQLTDVEHNGVRYKVFLSK